MSSKSRQLWDHFYSIDDIVDVQDGFVCNELSPDPFLDLPPESFWVPKSRERDWVDHHALMQRTSSMKLGFVGNSTITRKNVSVNPKSFSQWFSPSPSQKSKASFIGLPKTQKSCLLDGYHDGRHRKAGGIGARLFRSRSEPRGNLVLPDVLEPGSPKVSCTGRVETQKGRPKRPGLWVSLKSIVVRIGFRPNHNNRATATATATAT